MAVRLDPHSEEFFTKLQSLEVELHRAYERYLKPHDVEWPGGQALTGLLFLFYKMPHLVGKDLLTVVVRRIHPGSGDYQDARHLADRGWDVGSTNRRFSRGTYIDGPPGHYVLRSDRHPNPVWLTKAKAKRRGHLAAESWNELLIMYQEHGCAVCGQRSDAYDRGHLDPTKAPTLGNIVPMCVECNQWAQSQGFAFRMFGKVARPICLKCASER